MPLGGGYIAFMNSTRTYFVYFIYCAILQSLSRVLPLKRDHQGVSWSRRLPCPDSIPLGMYASSSWWYGNDRHWMDRATYPNEPWWTRHVNRWSNDKPASKRLVRGTCHRSTSSLDMMLSSMRIKCTRTSHPILHDHQPIANIAHCLSPQLLRF